MLKSVQLEIGGGYISEGEEDVVQENALDQVPVSAIAKKPSLSYWLCYLLYW